MSKASRKYKEFCKIASQENQETKFQKWNDISYKKNNLKEYRKNRRLGQKALKKKGVEDDR